MDTLFEIYGDLMRNKLRTIATGFAVTSGLFLLIVLLGAGNGLIHSFQYNMGDMAFDAIHVYGGWTSKPFEGIKEGREITLDKRDEEMTHKRFADNVRNLAPTVEQRQTVAYGPNHVTGARINGVQPSYATATSIDLLAGRFVNQIDIEQRRKVVVVGSNNIENLFDGIVRFDSKEQLMQYAVGKNITVGGIPYTIAGVYKTNEMSNSSEFYTPFTTLSTIYNRGEFIDKLTMTIRDIPSEEAMDKFIADYRTASSRIHSFDPTDRRALWIWNQAADSAQMNNAMGILNTSFWILGMLTLLSGIVGVSNIMLISIKERTHEFGIRRAIGARPFSIIKLVVLESIAITAIFGYIGMVLGVFFCEWMDRSVGNQTMDVGVFQAQYFIDPTVDIGTCVHATVVIIIAGALAGLFPALKATRIKPIEALRG